MKYDMSAFIFNQINLQTTLIIGCYPEIENTLNEWYCTLILESDDEQQAYKIYLTNLIALLENLEDYERCASLLQIRNLIK